MWAKVVVLLLLVPACRVQYLEEEAEEYKNADFYDNYEETETTIQVLTTTPMESPPYTRVRRYGSSNKKRTLDPQEFRDIKDVLRDIFANRRIEAGAAAELTKTSTLFDSTPQSDTSFDQSHTLSQIKDTVHNQTDFFYDQSEKPTLFSNTSRDTIEDAGNKTTKDILIKHTDSPLVSQKTYAHPYDWMSSERDLSSINETQGERSALKEAIKRLNRRVEIWEPQDVTNTILTTLLEFLDNSTEKTLNPQEIRAVDDALQRFIAGQKRTVTRTSKSPSNSTANPDYLEVSDSTEESWETKMSTVTELYEVTEYDEGDTDDTDADDGGIFALRDKKTLKRVKEKKKRTKRISRTQRTLTPRLPGGMMVDGKWHTFPPGWPYKSTLCPTTQNTPYKLDISGMLKILANLTYDYDMDLVERFNESMYAYSIPTCPTYKYGYGMAIGDKTTVLDFDNTTVVAKCFVCGLTATHIPQDAYCGDAFAGDFLPLVPVDPRARGHIARYRKYCRYLDSRTPIEIPEHPRAVYGRFSGGCSVRWTDLSGVYTQRTCRSKRRAVTGNHFGSKRMAKLEMALNHLDNGCIISPMATLLPLSRGISLYARFHACVCTGAWCNQAKQEVPWMVNIIITFWFYNLLKNK
ncbi:unnamed protein product [Arctia plantaginis]|uniref:Uncharacterized protein n=1 Tax=Arctia plantaginis TaxID=874455 RepID=A0A8S0ZXD6_ARCPL|nr:unnamed protein product [Arctia plantaginis]